MVHQDLDLVQRILRDQLSDDFTAIRVDSEEEYLRTVEFINRIAAADGQSRQALHARRADPRVLTAFRKRSTRRSSRAFG